MTITHDSITTTLTSYLATYPTEKERLARLLTALDERRPIWSRREQSAHLTCGAVAFNEQGRVLHVHHRALSRWLLPGGHVDPGDASLPAAAIRELQEETGLTIGPGSLSALSTVPIDIDVHPIPANPAKGEPDHYHFDFRYLIPASPDPVQMQQDEVSAFRWQPLTSMPPSLLQVKLSALR